MVDLRCRESDHSIIVRRLTEAEAAPATRRGTVVYRLCYRSRSKNRFQWK